MQFEAGGQNSFSPWIRRTRASSERTWTSFSQEVREMLAGLVDSTKVLVSPIKPRPFIDVITYDITNAQSWEQFVMDLGAFDANEYNSLAIDSLQEFAYDVRTYTKGDNTKLMSEVNFSWVQAQERAQIQLRTISAIKKKGVVVYTIGNEDISKDYVKSPMEKKKGEMAQEPYSIKGTVNLPGQLATSFPHIPDVLAHAKLISNQPRWVTEPEPLPGGVAWWDAKDRWGRIPRVAEPSFRTIFQFLYGKEGAQAIYDYTKQYVTDK